MRVISLRSSSFNRGVTFSQTASALLATFVIAWTAAAVEPELRFLRPVAGTQGTNTLVAAAAKVDPWPPEVWVDAPGIVFTPTPVTGVFNVEVTPAAAPGPHLVRFFNEEG